MRTTPELHRAVALEALDKGLSLNTWVESALRALVAHRPKRARGPKGAGKP